MAYSPVHFINLQGQFFKRLIKNGNYYYVMDENIPKLMYTPEVNCQRYVLTEEGYIYDLDKKMLIESNGLTFSRLFEFKTHLFGIYNKTLYLIDLSNLIYKLILVNTTVKVRGKSLSSVRIHQVLVSEDHLQDHSGDDLEVELFCPMGEQFLIKSNQSERWMILKYKDKISHFLITEVPEDIIKVESGLFLTSEKAYCIDDAKVSSLDAKIPSLHSGNKFLCNVPIKSAAYHYCRGEKMGILLLGVDRKLRHVKEKYTQLRAKLKFIDTHSEITGFIQFQGTTGVIDDQGKIYLIDRDHDLEEMNIPQ